MWLFGSAKVITQINTTILLLHRVLNNQTQLQKELNHMSQELDALTAEVANVKTVEASAVALIESLAAKITAAGTDPVALKALTDDLTASSAALAAAVAANTPPTV